MYKACGLLIGLLCLWLQACGTNIFEGVESHDPAEKALSYMDENKPDAAIDLLDDALKDDPENWILVSLMASAKAQKAGVDTTDIALKMATKGESQGNGLTSLFTILPEANSENVELLKEAVTYLNSIPTEERVAADTFKLTIFNTAFTALQAKIFDNDGNGKFTVEELSSLDDATASAIIDSLLNAENAAAAYTAGDSTGEAAGKVGAIKAQIDSQPGASTAEKLRNYLGTNTPAA